MNSSHRKKPSRRGVSLIETLVIISAASTILTLTGLLIHRTMQASTRAHAFHADEAVAWRLSAQLRLDAIGTIDAELNDTSLSLNSLDGSVIRYDFSTPTVARIQSRPNEREAHSAYPIRSVTDWQLRETNGPHQLALRALSHRDAGPGPTGAPLRLCVTVRLPEAEPSAEGSP